MAGKFDNFDSIDELFQFLKSLFEKMIRNICEIKEEYGDKIFENAYMYGEEPYPGARMDILKDKNFDIFDIRCYPNDMTWVFTCKNYNDFVQFWDKKYEFQLFYLTNFVEEISENENVIEYYSINDDDFEKKIYFYADEDAILPRNIMQVVELIGEKHKFD